MDKRVDKIKNNWSWLSFFAGVFVLFFAFYVSQWGQELGLWLGKELMATIIISIVGGAFVAWGASYFGAKAGGEVAKDAAIIGAERAAEIASALKRHDELSLVQNRFLEVASMLAGNMTNAETCNYLPYKKISSADLANIFKYLDFDTEKEREEFSETLGEQANIIATMAEYPSITAKDYLEALKENRRACDDLKKFIVESKADFVEVNSILGMVYFKFDKIKANIARRFDIERFV